MKSLFVIFVMSGVLLQSTAKLAILLRFRIHQEYIAKELCVQKAVKNNCCQGKCHLKKELKENDKKEQQPGQSSLKDKSPTILFFQAQLAFSLLSPVINSKPVFFYPSATLASFPFSIFHPPCVA